MTISMTISMTMTISMFTPLKFYTFEHLKCLLSNKTFYLSYHFIAIMRYFPRKMICIN